VYPAKDGVTQLLYIKNLCFYMVDMENKKIQSKLIIFFQIGTGKMFTNSTVRPFSGKK